MAIKKSNTRLVLRLLMALTWIIFCVALFLVGRILHLPGHKKIVPLFHKGLLKLFGLKVTYHGSYSQYRPTLYVSNHNSYLDIPILGPLPSFFIAKSDIANWPVIGYLCTLQNTLFIERKAGRAKAQIRTMQSHLKDGNSLTLFAEGTSTDGAHIEPFKSSLFEAANLSDDESPNQGKSELQSRDNTTSRVAIQPITIIFTHVNGVVMDQAMRNNYAWYADMSFGAHAMNALKIKSAASEVHFHPVCYLDDFDSRKQCADHCQKVVADCMHAVLNQEINHETN